MENIYIHKGESHYEEFIIKGSDQLPIDLTGKTFKAEVRKRSGSASLLDLSDGFAVVGDAEDGVLGLTITAQQTHDLGPGVYCWDCFMTYTVVDYTYVQRRLGGEFVVKTSITDPASDSIVVDEG